MLEWISTNAVMGVAALILVASVAGFFAVQRRAAEDAEIRGLAAGLAERIEAAGTGTLGAAVIVAFGVSGAGVLPATFRDRPYTVDIYPSAVILSQDGAQGKGNLLKRVHPYAPSELDNGTSPGHTTASELGWRDGLMQRLRVHSTEKGFMLESVLIVVDGNRTYQTFVHL